MTLLERLEANFIPEPNTGCFLWLGTLRPDGYGMLNLRNPKRIRRAHRLYYELIKGPIPEGLQLDHTCRMRCCVNPDHLEPVALAVNVRRGEKAQRQLATTHCPAGHQYAGANLKIEKDGSRKCRRCQADRALLKYHRNDK